jgi:hypothetical protein
MSRLIRTGAVTEPGRRRRAVVIRSDVWERAATMDAEAALRALPGDGDFELEIRRGNEHWRGGELTLVVSGSGAVRVRHRRDGDEQSFRGSLTPERLRALAGRLGNLGLADDRPEPGPRSPDEQLTTLVIRRGPEELLRRSLAENDRYDDERVDGLLEAYEELASEVSGGAVPFGPGATR